MLTAHIMHVPGHSLVRDSAVKAWHNMKGVEPVVHADPQKRGILWNHRRIVEAMLERKGESEWHLAVQDDARPLFGWMDHLEQVKRHAPRPIVSLSHFDSWGAELVEKGAPFGISADMVWGQAILFHDDALESYVQVVRDICEAGFDEFKKHDDQVPFVWAMLEGSETCMTSRALFTHIAGRSTVGNRLGDRKPEATIEQEGPDYDAEPYIFPERVLTSRTSQDKMLDLVRRYRKQTGRST